MSDMSMPTIVETGKNNDNGWGGNETPDKEQP